MLNQVEYYRDGAVRDHIRRFARNSAYLVGYGEAEIWKGNEKGFYTATVDHLDGMCDRGLDILLCLQQNDATLGLLDIEYYNPRYPGEAHLNPRRVFHLLEPIYRRAVGLHRKYGIPFVANITGQGYHIWSRFPFGPRHKRLEKIGRLEPTLAAAYARRHVPRQAALGFSGMGRLQLFLAGELLRQIGAARRGGERILPVYFSDINPPFGRDAVSIDLTTYADPVYMRDARVPFSSYQKHKVVREKVGEDNARRLPVEIIVPRATPAGEIGLARAMHLRRHFRDAAAYAHEVSTDLPDAGEGWLRVLAAFRESKIGAFFHHYDQGTRRAPKFAYRDLPPCIRHALRPDQLLEPTQAQAAVRVLDSMGFHPKEIAEAFHRKYKRVPFGHYNPQRRAAFWVECYAAMIHAGIDPKRDLTCLMHQRRDRCVQPMCGWDLSKYR